MAASGTSYQFSEDGKRFDRADRFNPSALTVLPEQSDEDLSDDDFRVLGGENGSILVKARGKQQIFNGVSQVVGDA